MPVTLLVRYGRIPEVARVQAEAKRERGDRVVVRTRRGTELATVLEALRTPPKKDEEAEASDFTVLRDATSEDQFEFTGLSTRAAAEFPEWVGRVREWNLDLQVVDLEWTLDREKLIVYVLNERGPESTKLAIQAAAAGLGLIEVQPVSKDGLVELPSGGGCGTDSCGCSH
jgi:cell fate regulator YaaT (PSP1 superfamily)